MAALLSNDVRDRILELHRKLREESWFLPADERDAAYRRFRERFGPQRLLQLQGKALLEGLFLHGNRDSLVYWLEFKNDEELPDRFGGIGGGSAYKFILFKQRETGQWTTGSPRIPKLITEDEAIVLATQIRDQFVACCKVLDRLHQDSTLLDYEQVNRDLKSVGDLIQHKAFAHKYFALLYPEFIDDFHALKWQNHQLLSMGIDASTATDRYERAYFFKEVRRELGLHMNELTGTLNALFGLPRRYWRVGTSFNDDTDLWPLFRDEGVVAIGWGELGDLGELGDTSGAKSKLAERLRKEFNTHGSTASRKAGEIISFRHKLQGVDIVVAASGMNFLGIGEVVGEYQFVPNAAMGTNHRIPVDWFHIPTRAMRLPVSGEGLQTTCKELRKPENQRFIESLWRGSVAEQRTMPEAKHRTAHGVASHWKPRIHQIKSVLERKGQAILYGPPGTGKTYWARLAAHELAAWAVFSKAFNDLDANDRALLVGTGGKEGLVRSCTFHPAYGYEDFLEGYRPNTKAGALSFELRDGIFKRLCLDAAKAPDKPHYLLVDEINRGDIPRIFGELLTLLEMDKRGMAVTLPVSGTPFSVPPNVYLIGTMNTADRSIALLDTALRRRFGFLELLTEYDLLREMVLDGFPAGEWLKRLNSAIREQLGNDGRNLQVGHAYFMHQGEAISDAGHFTKVLLEDVIPLLEEYFYDMPDRLPKLLGTILFDTREQRVIQELFAPGRRADLFRGLASLHPDLTTSLLALSAAEEEGEEEDGTEEELEDEPVS